jgi:hypothetical protein
MADEPNKPSAPKPELDPNKPDPNVQPPVFDIVTEGETPDNTVFKVRDGKSEKKED